MVGITPTPRARQIFRDLVDRPADVWRALSSRA